MWGQFRRHIYKYILDLSHSKAKHSIGTVYTDILQQMEVSIDFGGLSVLSWREMQQENCLQFT